MNSNELGSHTSDLVLLQYKRPQPTVIIALHFNIVLSNIWTTIWLCLLSRGCAVPCAQWCSLVGEWCSWGLSVSFGFLWYPLIPLTAEKERIGCVRNQTAFFGTVGVGGGGGSGSYLIMTTTWEHQPGAFEQHFADSEKYSGSFSERFRLTDWRLDDNNGFRRGARIPQW